MLIFPSFDLPFLLSTDASDGAIGAVLSQRLNGHEHLTAYWSRQLQKAECNYSTIERDALAVVSAVKHFYPYLYGHSFTLFTDHNPLTSLKALKDTGGQISRWLLFLQQFNFTFTYQPGAQNCNADTLSRIPQQSVSAVFFFGAGHFQEAQQQDTTLANVIKALQLGDSVTEPTAFARQGSKLFLQNEILCRLYHPTRGASIAIKKYSVAMVWFAG